MSDSVLNLNTYEKNNKFLIGDFPVATGRITNCPVPTETVETSAVSVVSEPPCVGCTPYYVPPSNVSYVPIPILGCTDRSAINYNPLATKDDGTCLYISSVNK